MFILKRAVIQNRVPRSCRSTSAGSIRPSITTTWPTETINPFDVIHSGSSTVTHQFTPDLSGARFYLCRQQHNSDQTEYWHLVQRSVTVFGRPSMYGQQ